MGRVRFSFLAGSFLVFVFLGLRLVFRDSDPPSDADLIPAAVPVADADNVRDAAVRLNDAARLTAEEKSSLSALLEARSTDTAAGAALIARHADALKLFDGFARGKYFQDPGDRNPGSIVQGGEVPKFVGVLAAARLRALQSKRALDAGRGGEALGEALSVADAGRVLLRSRGQLIEPLVGVILVELGARAAADAVSRGGLDAGRLRSAAARLSAPTTGAAALQEGLRYEYVAFAHFLDRLPQVVVQGDSPYDPRRPVKIAAAKGWFYIYLPNRTRALFSGRSRTLIEEAGKPCLNARAFPREPLPVGIRPNALGLILFDIATPDYQKLSARRCAADFRLTAAAVDAAARAYRQDHGRFPPSLDQLTPKYLPSAPLDAFTGDAPSYSAATGEIHSAGKDPLGRPL